MAIDMPSTWFINQEQLVLLTVEIRPAPAQAGLMCSLAAAPLTCRRAKESASERIQTKVSRILMPPIPAR